MTFDIQKILQSKRELRRGLAALPIEEKLRLLDALRERQLALRDIPMTTHPKVHADEHGMGDAPAGARADAG
jgi:hypothetical protein